MQKNFTIRDFVDVIVDDTTIELEAFYRATSIGTDPEGNAITLVFERDHRWPSPARLPERVTLICSGSLKLAFSDLCTSVNNLQDQCVELAYYDEHCGWDSFLDEELAVNEGFEGLHISFDSGLALRIRAESAKMRIA